MAAAWFCSASLRRFDASRGVDGGQLVLESATVGLRKRLDRTHGAERSDRCTEQRDAGKEEKGFLFGWCWHAATLPHRGAFTSSNRCVANRFVASACLTRHERYGDVTDDLQASRGDLVERILHRVMEVVRPGLATLAPIAAVVVVDQVDHTEAPL